MALMVCITVALAVRRDGIEHKSAEARAIEETTASRLQRQAIRRKHGGGAII